MTQDEQAAASLRLLEARLDRAGERLRVAMRCWVRGRMEERFSNAATVKAYVKDVLHVLDELVWERWEGARRGSGVRLGLGHDALVVYLAAMGERILEKKVVSQAPVMRRRIMAVKRLLEMEEEDDTVDWKTVADARRAVELLGGLEGIRVGPEMIIMALDDIDKQGGPIAARDRCLMLLMYLAYLRPGEVLALRCSDVSVRDDVLRVRRRDGSEALLGPRGAVSERYCPVRAYEVWRETSGRAEGEKLFCSFRRGFGPDVRIHEDLSEWGLRCVIGHRLGSMRTEVPGATGRVKPRHLRASFLAFANQAGLGPFADTGVCVALNVLGQLVVANVGGGAGPTALPLRAP